MTTAHRPTWKAAVGQANEGGYGAKSGIKSVYDEPAHTKLKVRKKQQLEDLLLGKSATSDEKSARLQASIRKLQEAESKLRKKSSLRKEILQNRREIDPETEKESRIKLLKQTAEVDEENLRQKYDDADDEAKDKNDEGGGGMWSDVDNDSNLGGSDSDTDLDDSDSDNSDSSDDEEDDEDEEAALHAELAKIKAEREAAAQKKEQENAKEEEVRMEEAALMGNPLLNNNSAASAGAGSSGKMKRRWNDDVVFRNQARDEPDRNKKRFINDTVRNDFHKRFLYKFVR